MSDVNSLNIDVKLSARELRFVQEYPACNYNGKEAAIRAGFSKRTAAQAASRVLKKVRPLVHARQQAEEQRVAEACKDPSSRERAVAAIATLEQSLELVTSLAFYDPRNLYEGDTLKPQSKLTRQEALMVSAFELDENFVKVGEAAEHVGYTKKVRLVDRAPYLNMLLKWHRAFPSGAKEPPKSPEPAAIDFSNWTTEDFETYQKLKAKLTPTVIDATRKPPTP